MSSGAVVTLGSESSISNEEMHSSPWLLFIWLDCNLLKFSITESSMT